jgi:hypothetical protein
VTQPPFDLAVGPEARLELTLRTHQPQPSIISRLCPVKYEFSSALAMIRVATHVTLIVFVVDDDISVRESLELHQALEIQAAVFQSKVREPSVCLRQGMPGWRSTGGLFRQPLFLPSADARGRSLCGPI